LSQAELARLSREERLRLVAPEQREYVKLLELLTR